MGCEIISDTLDLEMESLEAILPDPSKPETIGQGFPFPMLRRSGQVRQMSLRTITLRNDFVEAVFCVDLGGRFLSLRDIQNGFEALPSGLTLVDDSKRGVTLNGGLELLLNGTRLGAMAAVDFATHEDESAELVMFELGHGSGLAWTLRAELEPDSVGINCSLSLQNRGGARQEVKVGWRGLGDRVGVISDSPLAPLTSAGGIVGLEPHQVISFSFGLVPLTFPALACNGRGAVGLTDGAAHLQVFGEAPAAKLVVQTEKGPLEAQVELTANKPEKIDLSSISGEIKGLALFSQGEPLIQWPAVPTKEYEEEAGTRHFAHWQRALDAIRNKDFVKADHHLETSLLYNGDDPMAWWLKAVVQRHLGVDGERPELLNAHFLSPLDPALRAESFLTQNEHVKEPSPLIVPLARDPDSLTEVVCLLIDCHLIEDATRLIDEGLRHGEHRMLRYLMAYLHLQHSNMEFEAATHVKAAEAIPIGPPYPWRATEREALKLLHERFPNLPHLAHFAALADS
ncbi:MAG: hypothetical protein JNK63_10750 [Chthonomonas sp.]|nr:hypothetical protein [Chthonomonas sp.]